MKNFYTLINGAEGVNALVTKFYDLMDSSPEAKEIRALHPSDLGSSREKLFLFLSGWFGGPPLFEERFGHPRLRARHLPFVIGPKERDQWMWCMDQALLCSSLNETDRAELRERFQELATHMINVPQEGGRILKRVTG